MFRNSPLLWIFFLTLLSNTLCGQVTISEETFDDGDGAMSGTMTDGSPWAVTAVGDCGNDGGVFEIQSGSFEVTNTEGLNCCECFPGGGGTQCGDAGNTVVFGPIDISGFFGIEITIDFSQIGDLECYSQFENPPLSCPDSIAVICAGGNDQAIFSYQVDGGPWTIFAYYCGDQFCFGQGFTCGVDRGSVLNMRMQAGTQTNSETYLLNSISVAGYNIPLATATADGQDNTQGTYNICQFEDLDLSETAGQAASWSWTGPNGFSSNVQSPTITDIDLAASGTYFVEITDANGCPETDTIDVFVVPEIELDPIPDVAECNFYVLPPIQGENLTGNEAYYTSSGGNGTQYNSGDTIFNDITLFAYDDNLGCSDENNFQVSLTIVNANTATLSECDAGSGMATFDLTSVNGDITGGQGGTVQFYTDMSATNPINNPSAYQSGNATIWATVTRMGCTSSVAPVTLFVVIPEFGDFEVFCSPGNSACAVCDDDYDTNIYEVINISFSPDGPYCYIIEVDDDTLGVNVDTFCSAGPIPYTIGGDATITILGVYNPSDGCVDLTGLGSATVDYAIPPDIDDIPNMTACDSFSFPPITGTNLSGNEAYYTMPGGMGTQFNEGDIVFFSGTFWLYGGVSFCTDEESFTLTIVSSPDPSFDYPDICANESGFPENVATPGGTWAFNPDPIGPATIDPVTGEINNGLIGQPYTVQYTVGSGMCTDTATQVVNVIEVPSATFSFLGCDPNNPGFWKASLTTSDSLITTVGDIIEVAQDSYDIINIPSGAQYDVIWLDPVTGCGASITQVAGDCSCNPNPPISNGDTAICLGDPIPTISVTIDPGLEADWYDAETGGNLLQDNSTTFTPTSTGTYWVEAYDPVGMCSSPRISITISVLPNPMFNISPPDCNGDGTWFVDFSIDDTQVSASADAGVIIDNMDGTFTLDSIPGNLTSIVITFTQISSGCDTDVTSVLSDPCPCTVNPPTSNGDQEACENDPIPTLSVNAPPGAEVDWYDAETGGDLIQDNSTDYTPTGAGTYWAEIVGTQCSSDRTSVTLTIIPLPTFIGLDTICDLDNDTYTFVFQTDAEDVLPDAGTLIDNGDGTYDLTNIPDGTNVQITLNTTLPGCASVVTLNAPNCACPDVVPPSSGGDVSTCPGDPNPELAVVPGAGLFVDWYDAPSDGNLLLIDSDTYSPVTPGTYYAETRDSDGCVSGSRTPVTWIANDNPTFNLLDTICSNDLLFYVAIIETDGDDIAVSNGNVVPNGDGTFNISNVPAGTDLNVTITNTTTGCDTMVVVPSPICNCPVVNPPISSGDEDICTGDIIPALSVTADPGLSVDWYDAPIGGNLLLADSDVYIPNQAGTYYAESIDNNGCTSAARTAVTLIINDRPDIALVDTICDGSQQFYSAVISTDADIVDPSEGILIDNGDGTFEINNIPVGTNLDITLEIIASGCDTMITIASPECACPFVTPPAPLEALIEICEEEDIPSLEVTVEAGLEADWYDAPSGGTLLATNTTTYQPTDPGVYYAESRDPGNDCTSTRVPIELVINAQPTASLDSVACANDLLSYAIWISTDVDSISTNTGVVIETGIGTFQISDIEADSNIVIELINTSTNCANTISITAPDCNCPVINRPQSNGDVSICEGQPNDTLFVSADFGLTIDWYNMSTGGTLLATGQSFYVPTMPGTYFAESRDSTTGCVSTTRIDVTLTEIDTPNTTLIATICNFDDSTYAVLIQSDADSIHVPELGNGFIPNGDTVIISQIPDTLNITVVGFVNTAACNSSIGVEAPSCQCETPPMATSLGDVIACELPLPPFVLLQVIIPTDQIDTLAVDWYDAPVGGNLLVEGSLILTTPTPGTYYAETRNIYTDCINEERVPVSYVSSETPYIDSLEAVCITDSSNYSITFESNADSIGITAGNITGSPGVGLWIISDVPNGISPTITLYDFSRECDTVLTITAPDCGCPLIEAPVISGDTAYCNGDAFPTLSVPTVDTLAIFWYDDPAGVNAISNGSNFQVSGSGTYYVSYVDTVRGCSSELTAVNILEYPLPTLEITSIECQPSGDFYDVTFTSNANDFFFLLGTLNSLGGDTFQIINIPIDQPDIIIFIDTVTTCGNGESYFPPNCDCPDLVEPLVSGDVSYCEGSNIPDIQASGFDGTIYWYDVAVGGSPIFENVANITPPGPGIYYAENVDTVSGCTSDRVSVMITQNTIPAQPVSNGDFTFCSGDVVVPVLTVTLPDGVVGNWYNAETGGTIVAAQTDGFTPPAINATYWVEAVDTATGCVSPTRTPMNVIEAATPTVDAGSNTTNCQLQGITLGTASVADVMWSSPDAGVTFDEVDNPMTAVTVASPGIYTLVLTANDQSCIAVDSIEYRFSEISAEITGQNADCGEANGFIFIDNVTGGVGPYEYDLNADFNDDIDETPEVISIDSADNYSVVVSDAFGCSVQENIQIEFAEGITLELGPDQTIFPGESALVPLDVSGDPIIYTWSPNENILCPDCDVAELSPQTTTRYTLIVEDEDGCSAVDDIVIRLEANLEVYIPNAFSPNDDGINDVFSIYSNGDFNILSFDIYNRWGDRVFQRSAITLSSLDGWDGRVLDEEAEVGVYVYTLTVQLPGGIERSYKGDVHLIR